MAEKTDTSVCGGDAWFSLLPGRPHNGSSVLHQPRLLQGPRTDPREQSSLGSCWNTKEGMWASGNSSTEKYGVYKQREDLVGALLSIGFLALQVLG